MGTCRRGGRAIFWRGFELPVHQAGDGDYASPMSDHPRARALHLRLVAARRAHRQSEHQLATLLAELDEASLYRPLGYVSLAEYAGKVLDLSSRQARELARLGRRLPALPELDAAMAAGELDWTKAREIARVANAETVAAWVARAREVSSRELERQVAVTHVGHPPPDEMADEPMPARRRLVFEMEASDAEAVFDVLAMLRAKAGLKASEVEDGALLAALARTMLREAEPVDAPTGEPYRVVVQHCPDCGRDTHPQGEVSETVASEARCDAEVIDMRPGPKRGHAASSIPPAVRCAVFVRDGWCCATPGCESRLWIHLHHWLPRSRGGGNDEDNLVTLCAAHHRALHDGTLALERLPDGRIRVTHGDGRTCVGERGRRGAAVRAPPVEGSRAGPAPPS